MTISMHKAMAPVFLRMFANLDAMLDKLEADAKARNYSPDVVLTDLEMPRLDGIGLIRRTPSPQKLTMAFGLPLSTTIRKSPIGERQLPPVVRI